MDIKIKKPWIKRNWISIVLVVLLVGMTLYHYFGTYNPPITQAVIVDPKTKDKLLPNGQYAQTKVSTPGTQDPTQAGFSEAFVKDTIQGIIGIKNKEQILAINQVTGTYKDSLQLYKSELDAEKRRTRYYQSKDSKGNVVGSAKVTDDGPLVYKADLDLTTVKKSGKVDRRGNKITPDSLIFYDPTQRATIRQSKEFVYTIPPEVKKRKLKVSPVLGIGVVAPVDIKDSKINIKEVKPGLFGGIGFSYTF